MYGFSTDLSSKGLQVWSRGRVTYAYHAWNFHLWQPRQTKVVDCFWFWVQVNSHSWLIRKRNCPIISLWTHRNTHVAYRFLPLGAEVCFFSIVVNFCYNHCRATQVALSCVSKTIELPFVDWSLEDADHATLCIILFLQGFLNTESG